MCRYYRPCDHSPHSRGGGKNTHRQMTSGVAQTIEVKKSIRQQGQKFLDLPKGSLIIYG